MQFPCQDKLHAKIVPKVKKTLEKWRFSQKCTGGGLAT